MIDAVIVFKLLLYCKINYFHTNKSRPMALFNNKGRDNNSKSKGEEKSIAGVTYVVDGGGGAFVREESNKPANLPL